MTKKRFARIATLVAGCALTLTLTAPVAHADDLANLRGIVNRDRATTTCQALKYNQTLQDIGFAMGQFIPEPQASIDQKKAQYGGDVLPFIGVGDPIAAATTDAYKRGAGPALSDCYWTEFGVSFTRYETTETDWVGIIFGRPATVTPPVGPGVPGGAGTPPAEEKKALPPVEPNVVCPPGGPQKEVPPGQTCPPPTNAVTVSFNKPTFGNWTVTVKNNAGIGGSCTYDATPVGFGLSVHEDFDIGPNTSHSFTVLNPGVLKYDTVTVCTGTYDGKQVEFGRVNQGV
ncbi:MAG: hypothetical protein QOC76_1014 [Mycobacterium sp.]|jgi:hypothetical protein|nr:hypothetical protein [Mycobacterium sp.]